MQKPKIIEKCKNYNPITELGHCAQYCLPGGCPYVHPQQSQWYEAIPSTSPSHPRLPRPIPVLSDQNPQNNAPTAISVPTKGEGMKIDPPLQAKELLPTAIFDEKVASSSSVFPHSLSNHIHLILQYTCLSITAPTLQGHLRTIKRYRDAIPNPKPEVWRHDYKLADTELAALNTMRSNLVKELVQSDASQVMIDRRQRLEKGVTALRAAELLKKVETVRERIERSLKKKQEMIAKHNSRIQHQPGSSHKLNYDSLEAIDVDAIKTDDFDFDAGEAAPPTRRQTIEDVKWQVEGLANEVEAIADFMDIEHAKVGEEVQRLIPAWEASKKEGDGKEERKGVERMLTELAEAMQAVRDGVETIQSITTYAEQADADEEAEMVELRKEMALLQGERRTQQADLQKVRAEIEYAHWELPTSVDQDEFISNIRARVENLIQPLFDQLEAAETNEERLFKSMCDQELEEKRMVEEAELNIAIADGRRRTNELIANALSTVAMVKKDVRESQRRQEARQAAQRSASVNGQPGA